MGVYQRSERWMVFYHEENGKRRDKSFGRGERAQQMAEAFDLAVKENKKNGRPVDEDTLLSRISSAHAPKKPAPAINGSVDVEKYAITFGEICSAYIDDLKISGRSESHIQTVSIVVEKCYYAHMDKGKTAEAFTYLGDIVPFVKAMQGVSARTGRPRSQTTINRYLDYLDAIFNFGVRLELVSKNPVSARKKPKEAPRKVSLELSDIQKIMDAATPHIRWAIEVCFSLGTRSGPSELLSLKWESIDFKKKEVLIYGRKTKDFRTVPISDFFAKRLQERMKTAETEYVIEYKGKAVKSISTGFRNACQAAGIIYDVRMYDLRHLFATYMLSNGADLAAVSKLMGHSKVTQTANTYYQYLKGEKEKAIGLLPQLEVA